MAKSKKKELAEDAFEPSGDRFADILRSMNSKETTFTILSEDVYTSNVPSMPTGLISVDRILGGGIPYGRIIEVFGPFSSGKTTLAAQFVAEAQRRGGICSYVDVENSVSPKYFNDLGVDWNKVLFTQPDSGEAALNIVMNLLPMFKRGDIIVVDSVAALTPAAELSGEIGDQFMGLQARMMGQAMRKLVGLVSEHEVILIFINQIREALNVTYGPSERNPGGRSLPFYASIRIDIRSIGKIKRGEEVIGNKTKIKTVKNKVFPPFRECEVEMIFGEGISPIRDLITNAIEFGVIEKGGAWLTIGANRVQGMDNAFQLLKNDPELYAQIYAQTIDALKNKA